MTERKIIILITILFYFIFSGITLKSAASVSEGTSLPSFVAFESDRSGQQHTYEELTQIAQEPGQELTFTCVPPGSGDRIGIDRDEDGIYDADETDEVY